MSNQISLYSLQISLKEVSEEIKPLVRKILLWELLTEEEVKKFKELQEKAIHFQEAIKAKKQRRNPLPKSRVGSEA